MVNELGARSVKHRVSVALHCRGNVLEVLHETAITLGDDGWSPGDPEQEVAVPISGLRRFTENI
jgi:hypothetical protein